MLPDSIFCLFWNVSLSTINNSVRIKKIKSNIFLIKDKSQEIEIFHKKRFEYYLQNIETRLNHLTKEYMFNEIRFEQNDVIIDCGANIGEIFLSIKQLKNSDYLFKYYGFEPDQTIFELLQNNTNNEIKEPLALASEEGHRKLYLRSKTADSSFEEGTKEKFVMSKTVTLDNIFSDFKSIKLLKLEAEGYELDVLLGSKKILNKIKFISADLGYELENNTRRSFEEVDNFLSKNNFSLILSTTRETYLYKNKNYS
tara:strand:- start:2978 stop:3742 length:765 start_codon:yes stop_codon:yes gene_type:complete